MRVPDIQNFGLVHFRNRVFEPEELSCDIDRLAKYLREHLSDRHPFVYLLSTNHVKFVIAYFAVIKAGTICVLVEPDIGELEFQEMRSDSPPAAIIRVATSRLEFSYESEIELCRDAAQVSDELENVCTMIYTAADDGHMKGAMLTHENIVSDVLSGAECEKISTSSVSCAAIPYSHLFGLASGVLVPASQGGQIYIMDSDKSFPQMIADLVESPVTHLYTVPMILHLMTRARPAENARLTDVVCGGVALPRPVFERFKKKFGIEIRQGYGLSEASPICTLTRPGDVIVPDSVGRAMTCCKLRIADADRAQPTEHGPCGEILIDGANVMKGYYRRPQATATALSGGVLHTGDIGTIDRNGYLRLLGLKKRMLNRGGSNIYPSHIERLLRRHDGIHDASLTPLPDSSLLGTTKVHATIQLEEGYHLTPDEIAAWCEIALSPKNRPHVISIA